MLSFHLVSLGRGLGLLSVFFSCLGSFRPCRLRLFLSCLSAWSPCLALCVSGWSVGCFGVAWGVGGLVRAGGSMSGGEWVLFLSASLLVGFCGCVYAVMWSDFVLFSLSVALGFSSSASLCVPSAGVSFVFYGFSFGVLVCLLFLARSVFVGFVDVLSGSVVWGFLGVYWQGVGLVLSSYVLGGGVRGAFVLWRGFGGSVLWSGVMVGCVGMYGWLFVVVNEGLR